MQQTSDAPKRSSTRERTSVVRRAWLVAFGTCCCISLMACGLLTSLDGLTGGVAPTDAHAEDGHTILADGSIVVTTDGGADSSEPFVVYLPAPGNYQYAQNTAAYATGTDFDAAQGDLQYDILTLPNKAANRRQQASQMPARVDYLDGGLGACWTLSIQVLPSSANGAHRDEETFCARDGGLLDPGMHSTVQVQTWNLGPLGTPTSTAVVDCSSSNVYVLHGMKPGDSFNHACMGTAEQTSGAYFSSGAYAYVGRETTTTVDGVTEEVFHTLRSRTVGPSPTGFEITDFYLSTRDGLPLRIHRQTHIETPVTFVGINGVVIYDEHGSDWLLSSHKSQ
jgi:hypothetical protein